jgi:NUMOD4 motif-containing protein/HNH endonuclease
MEEWRAVVGYEGFYEVSDLGRVRSIDRVVACGHQVLNLKGKVLRVAIAKNGYPVVTLFKLGKGRTSLVHTLILEAFVGSKPTEMHEGCHGDGDRANSVLSNLRWGTPKENRNDSRRHGTLSKGEDRPNAKINEQIVQQIRTDTRSLTDIAKHHGIGLTTAWKVKNRVTWKHVE